MTVTYHSFDGPVEYKDPLVELARYVVRYGDDNALPSQESEEGKWFCGMWYEGMKAGTYWSHQRVKFAFEFDDTEFFVSIA